MQQGFFCVKESELWRGEKFLKNWMLFGLISVHPETTNFWMELSAVSEQQSANTLFLMSFAESRKLMADSAHPKTLVSGWALNR
jgi:hypothetical protein